MNSESENEQDPDTPQPELTSTELAIKKLVAAAPPLSPGQMKRLSILLNHRY